MKILVIGGSYFLGRVFTMIAIEKNDLYLLNRGTEPFEDEDIVEYVLDRHDAEGLKSLPQVDYDVVVDFCGYNPGDIKTIFDNIQGTFKQYIYISTCDVYKRGTGIMHDETSEFETRDFGGMEGAYILGKVALEEELRQCCSERGVSFTSIRPAFIYGPYNYAPRESIYFKWIISAGQIVHPSDATGRFQMVYVLDAAKAILAACGNKVAFNKAYNLCNSEMLNYDSFAEVLKYAVELEFEKVEVSVEDVLKQNIPLPFPLTLAESECYDGSKVMELGATYTDIDEGMKVTAEFFQR